MEQKIPKKVIVYFELKDTIYYARRVGGNKFIMPVFPYDIDRVDFHLVWGRKHICFKRIALTWLEGNAFVFGIDKTKETDEYGRVLPYFGNKTKIKTLYNAAGNVSQVSRYKD